MFQWPPIDFVSCSALRHLATSQEHRQLISNYRLLWRVQRERILRPARDATWLFQFAPPLVTVYQPLGDSCCVSDSPDSDFALSVWKVGKVCYSALSKIHQYANIVLSNLKLCNE